MDLASLLAGADVPEPEPDQADQVAVADDGAIRNPSVQWCGHGGLFELDVVLASPQVRYQDRRRVGTPALHDPAFQTEEESTMAVAVRVAIRIAGRVAGGKLPHRGALERDVAVGVLPEPLPAVLEPQAPRHAVRPRLSQERAGVALLGHFLDPLGNRLLAGGSGDVLFQCRRVAGLGDENTLLGEPDWSLRLEAGQRDRERVTVAQEPDMPVVAAVAKRGGHVRDFEGEHGPGAGVPANGSRRPCRQPLSACTVRTRAL